MLYKPVGAAKIEKTIDGNDENYFELLKFIQNKRFNFRIGFDTCQTPAPLRHNNTLTIEALDFCESGRFSMYINSRLMAYPCSFGSDCQEFIVDLGKFSIEQAWFSEQFDRFRKRQDYICSSCDKDCYGCALGINSYGIYIN